MLTPTPLLPLQGAAVSILETYFRPNDHQLSQPQISRDEDSEKDREVRGLARMVQTSSSGTVIDLTLRGVAPGIYRATIRELGDLKHGASSTGPVWSGSGASTGIAQNERDMSPRGALGFVEVGDDGGGSAFLDAPLSIWEIIGRAMVVTSQDESHGTSLQDDENTVVGVIARSAGVWDNDKTVCSCTGKTLWEERKEEARRGML